ncbi:MAG: hypothetical protein Q9220_001799 [cf. Caloplaca sp. 1 TL-2023]
MSSDSSSSGSQSEDEMTSTQSRPLTLTPRTPLSPGDGFPTDVESRPHRSSSFVRFQGLNAGKDGEFSASGKPPMIPASSEGDVPGNVPLPLQTRLLDRIEFLEIQFRNLESSQRTSTWEKGYVELGDDVRFQCSHSWRSGGVGQTGLHDSSYGPADSSEVPRKDRDESKHEVSEELLAQVEAIAHLRILTKFMEEDPADIFARHELLRSSEAEKVSFQDMWHLFMAGDLVVAESETSERTLELFQVSVLPAADFFASRRPVKQISTRTEGSQHLIESVYKEEAVSAVH